MKEKLFTFSPKEKKSGRARPLKLSAIHSLPTILYTPHCEMILIPLDPSPFYETLTKTGARNSPRKTLHISPEHPILKVEYNRPHRLSIPHLQTEEHFQHSDCKTQVSFNKAYAYFKKSVITTNASCSRNFNCTPIILRTLRIQHTLSVW